MKYISTIMIKFIFKACYKRELI